ncbi:hypothetical protein MLD38_020391 [Melastoma candidum]|uniref:Uncharacterized protein n=1 Tax=Melastoma candidum TaxID=119954 RepID=A0ACB9QC84_9MYRT|nr:hypothetical protein MLD38_020391 [Melastoma candidum]
MDGIEVGAETNKRLSIIDVSFEDDSLLDLSSSLGCLAAGNLDSDMRGNRDQETHLLESVGSEKWSSMKDSFEDTEKSFQEIPQPFQSCDPEKNGPNSKYNLRNSLAWDSAFFTSAGVLEPEELSCIIEGSEKKGKMALPRIQEETSRSTESISTLESDSLKITSLEAELFQDIRASIQKSAKTFIKDIPNGKTGSKSREKPPSIVSAKVDPGSHSKLKATNGNKKPSLSTGKNVKQLSGVPNMPQVKSVPNSGEPIHLPSRLPKLRAPRSQLPKRDSVGSNYAKPGKNNGDNAVRGPSLSKAKVMSNPRGPSARPSRSSINNAGANAEPATSRSSIESSGSASSISLGNSLIRFKNIHSDLSSGKSVSSNVKALPGGSQPTPTHLSSCLLLTSKISSSISPSSSISEWSSESSSSISSAPRRPYSGLTPPSQRNPLGQGEALPINMKPTGLRMPSPNIGYFDGVKSGGTPKGVKQRPQNAIAASNRNGSTSTNASGGSEKGNIEKQVSANKAGSARIGNRRLTSDLRDSPRKLTDAKAVAARTHGNGRNSPGPTAKAKSKVKEEPNSSEGCYPSAEFVDKDGFWSTSQLDQTLDSVDTPLISVLEKGAIIASLQVGVESHNATKQAADDGSAGNGSLTSELVSVQLQPKDDSPGAQELWKFTPKHSPSHASASPTEPFSLKDSISNQTGHDVTGNNIEKTSPLPFTNDMKENC